MVHARSEPLRLAIAGGGTGGHIVPGLHLLGHVRGTNALDDLLWFQSGREVEARALAGLEAQVQPTPLERVVLSIEPPGGGAPSKLRLGARSLPEFWRARRALRRHRTEVLLGLGGFTALPPALAAASLRIPVALLEINAAPGRATRWLGPLSNRVFHAWRASMPNSDAKLGANPKQDVGSHDSLSTDSHRWIGPPLSTEYIESQQDSAQEAASKQFLRHHGFDPKQPLLLVLGGSQGALGLNRFLAEQASVLLNAGVQVLHQVGPGRLEEAWSGGASASEPESIGKYKAVEYLDQVYQAIRASAFVLCRGGASTLAEVGALSQPAWVVPYPHHPDRHQERNAQELGSGVRIVQEHELSAEMAHELAQLCLPAGRLERARMAADLAGRVPRDASVRLLEELLAMRR